MFRSDFDPRSAERANRLGPLGPYNVLEKLPGDIRKWVTEIDPRTKATRELIMTDWEASQTELVLDDLQTVTHQWTLSTVKKREGLDKQDSRDQAHSLFSSDRTGRLRADGVILMNLYVAPNGNATANAIATAAAALLVTQNDAITALVGDANSPVVETDRPILKSFCALTAQEWGIYDEFLRVYDSALCHFVFEIVGPQLRRHLNAERLTKEARNPPVIMEWQDYRTLIVSLMRNSVESNDVLTFFLRVRDDFLFVALWVSERRSERSLLEKDGVTLPEKVWLAYVLCFIPSEERQLLEVPAEQDRDAFNGNVGYTMADLEASVKKVDPRTCKKFRQQWCTEPLAKRIIKLHKLMNPSPNLPGANKKKDPDKDAQANGLEAGKKTGNQKKTAANQRSNKPALTGGALKKLDTPASLPQKNGSADQDRYAKWKEGSLRRRVGCYQCEKVHPL